MSLSLNTFVSNATVLLNGMERVATPAPDISANKASASSSSPVAKSDEAKARSVELEEVLAATQLGCICCSPSVAALSSLQAPAVKAITGKGLTTAEPELNFANLPYISILRQYLLI